MSDLAPAERLRRRRCRMLVVAAVFGILLALFGAADENWVPVGVGVAGAALVTVVHLRSCRGKGDS